MRKLVDNDFIYFTGKYIMPVMGVLFNMCTFMLFFRYTYFFFYEFNTLMIWMNVSKLEKRELEIMCITDNYTWYNIKDTDFSLHLWHESQEICIFNDFECVISSFTSSEWDKNINKTIYNIFK